MQPKVPACLAILALMSNASDRGRAQAPAEPHTDRVAVPGVSRPFPSSFRTLYPLAEGVARDRGLRLASTSWSEGQRGGMFAGCEETEPFVSVTEPLPFKTRSGLSGQVRETVVDPNPYAPLEGIGLLLLGPMKSVASFPAEGNDLIVAGDVGGVLHVRIFDRGGRMIRDTDENGLFRGNAYPDTGSRAAAIRALREGVERSRRPHEMAMPEKRMLAHTVSAACGLRQERDLPEDSSNLHRKTLSLETGRYSDSAGRELRGLSLSGVRFDFEGLDKEGDCLCEISLSRTFPHEDGYGLRLVPSAQRVADIPAAGRDEVILASVAGVLHIRMFDGDGKLVADTDESKLTDPSQVTAIQELKGQMHHLQPPHVLTRSEKDPVILLCTAAAGHTPSDVWVTVSSGRKGKAFCCAFLDDLERRLRGARPVGKSGKTGAKRRGTSQGRRRGVPSPRNGKGGAGAATAPGGGLLRVAPEGTQQFQQFRGHHT